MNIPDTLRQEDMPEMVYTICKLALQGFPQKELQENFSKWSKNNLRDQIKHYYPFGKDKGYSPEEIKKLITLGNNDDQTSAQFSAVFNFAKEGQFIGFNEDGNVFPYFTPNELSNFRQFRYTVFRNIFQDSEKDSKFNRLAKWFLSQEIPLDSEENTTTYLSVKSSSDLLAQLPTSIAVDVNFIHGFRLWISALGMGAFYAPAKANTVLFASERIISEWLNNEQPFTIGVRTPIRDFINQLVKDCPVFESCVKNNRITAPLSMALRILENCGIIHLVRMQDSGDIWHLNSSVVYSKTDSITDIEYRGGII